MFSRSKRISPCHTFTQVTAAVPVAAPCGSAVRTRVPRPAGFGLLPQPRCRPGPHSENFCPWQRGYQPRLGSSAPSRPSGQCVPSDRAPRRNTMQTLKTITFFATVSNSATSRTSKNGRNYTAFGVSILDSNRTRRSTTTSLPSANRATSPASSRKAPASSSSSRRSPSPTTSPPSRFSQQPSCGRFVRPLQPRTKAQPSAAIQQLS